jgi:Tfp pilus assembly protein PilN
MSAQINLFEPRFLKQRDVISLGNVAALAIVTYLALAAAGTWAWHNAASRKQAAANAERQLKAAKDQVEAVTKAMGRKADPGLIAEAERIEAMVRRRAEIARMLDSGAIGNSAGFAEFLRGLARQVPGGLWLTGLSIGAGGQDVEIRGRTVDPAALPEYIRRLGTEKSFHGRNFAALAMNRQAAVPAQAAAVKAGSAAAVVAAAPQPIDFVLSPRLGAPADAPEGRQ